MGVHFAIEQWTPVGYSYLSYTEYLESTSVKGWTDISMAAAL
jgi:hypothetical protein